MKTLIHTTLFMFLGIIIGLWIGYISTKYDTDAAVFRVIDKVVPKEKMWVSQEAGRDFGKIYIWYKRNIVYSDYINFWDLDGKEMDTIMLGNQRRAAVKWAQQMTVYKLDSIIAIEPKDEMKQIYLKGI